MNTFPAILTAPLRATPLAFERSAASTAASSRTSFNSVAACPAAPTPSLTPSRVADRAYAFAARIANLGDVGAVLFEKRVRLLRGQFHCPLLFPRAILGDSSPVHFAGASCTQAQSSQIAGPIFLRRLA
jgi:hypothetical protein